MTYGLLSSSEIALIFNSIVEYVNSYRQYLGVDPYSESSSACAKAQAALEDIIGNGAGKPGISVSELQRQLIQPLGRMVWQSRYVDWTAMQLQQVVSAIDLVTSSQLPTEWRPTGRALDWWITRLNANSAGTPAAPVGVSTVAASGGSIQPCSSANAPSVYVTHVGATNNCESVASAPVSGVALYGPYGSYRLTISGTVPSGVSAIRIYRTRVGYPAEAPSYVTQVSVTAGSSYPSVTLNQPDANLRLDITVPSYASCLIPVGGALAYAIGMSAAGSMVSSMMMSPTNVAAVPTSGWTDLYGTTTPMVLATRIIGTSFVAGAYSTSNDPDNGIQGVYGATAIRLKVTSALNTGASITNIGYTYVDINNPSTEQSASVAGPISLSAAVGSVASISVPAGRVVRSITTDTCETATSGTYIYEAA